MNGQKNTLLWLARVAGREKLCIAGLLLLQAVLGGGGVLYALLLRWLVNSAAGGDRSGFFRAAGLTAALAAAQIALRAAGRFLRERTRAGVENRFKARLFSRLLRKDYAAVTAVHSGQWMNRLTSDTVIVADGLTDILPDLAGMAARLLGAAGAIIALEPVFAAILIPGGTVLLLATYFLRKALKKLHKQVQEADGAVRVFLQERLGGLLIVRSFGAEKMTEAGAEEKMRLHKRIRMKRNHVSNLCNVGFGAAVQGAYLLSAVYCGWGILAGTMSYGSLMAILQLVGQLQLPFANLTGVLPQYYALLASAERLMEAEAFQDDGGEAVPAAEIGCFYRKNFRGLGLRGASFTYQPPAREESASMPLVLRDISLEIRKGEYVALTGRSGCGKSTILKLLMCLYPLDGGGRYLLAGNGERELSAGWRGLFAYVPQGNQLMSGSIREIVAFGDSGRMRREEEIHRALEIACADEFVRALERGIDTILGERGAGLSEGQTQRVAIARAVFSGRPILLLDESTSALDEQTEQRLLANLRAMTDKTVIVVTHRPAVLAICDKRLEMTEEGMRTI